MCMCDRECPRVLKLVFSEYERSSQVLSLLFSVRECSDGIVNYGMISSARLTHSVQLIKIRSTIHSHNEISQSVFCSV